MYNIFNVYYRYDDLCSDKPCRYIVLYISLV